MAGNLRQPNGARTASAVRGCCRTLRRAVAAGDDRSLRGVGVAIVSLILLVLGWVIILVGAFGTGLDITVGNLEPLTTGIVFVLGGLTLRLMD
jgi:hypothetical protein